MDLRVNLMLMKSCCSIQSGEVFVWLVVWIFPLFVVLIPVQQRALVKGPRREVRLWPLKMPSPESR